MPSGAARAGVPSARRCHARVAQSASTPESVAASFAPTAPYSSNSDDAVFRQRAAGYLHTRAVNIRICTFRKLVRVVKQRDLDSDVEQSTQIEMPPDAFAFHQIAHVLCGHHLIAARR